MRNKMRNKTRNGVRNKVRNKNKWKKRMVLIEFSFKSNLNNLDKPIKMS